MLNDVLSVFQQAQGNKLSNAALIRVNPTDW